MSEKKNKKEQDELIKPAPVFFHREKEESKVVKRYRFKNDAARVRYKGNVIEKYQLNENFVSLYRHTPLFNLIEEY